MRVLIASKFWYLRGGLERVMFGEAEGLARAGHEVVHFSSAHPDNDPSPYSSYFVPYTELGGAGARGPLASVRAAANLFANPEARRCFARLLDDTRPDIVHIHGIHRQLSPSILLETLRRRIPVVQTLHDYHHICPADVLLRGGVEPCDPRRCGTLNYWPALRYRCLRGSLSASALSAAETAWQRARRIYERGVTRFISPSEFLAAAMRDGGWTVPIDVVRNAVPLPALAGPSATSEEPYFLVAGRLSPEKDVDTALRAAAQARVRVIVAGEGPDEQRLRRAFPGVDFVGRVDRERVRELLEGCRAAVVPSRWSENAPMSVLEAMAMGRPVIASRAGGIPELVRDGIDGLLVPPGDRGAFATCMTALVGDPARAAALGSAGRRRIADEFGEDRHMEGLLSVYDKARSALETPTRGNG